MKIYRDPSFKLSALSFLYIPIFLTKLFFQTSPFLASPYCHYYPTNIQRRKLINISNRNIIQYLIVIKKIVKCKLFSEWSKKKWNRNFEKGKEKTRHSSLFNFLLRGILLILFCPFCRSKFFSGQRSTGTMSHNILLGRFLPADRLFEGGSDAEAGDLRVPSWANDVAPCGRSPPRRPRRRRRKAFRDPLLQERRWVISLLITDYHLITFAIS